MEKNIICFECGAGNEYGFRKVSRKYEGDGYSFKMDVEIPICKCCGAPIDEEEIEEKIAKKANQKIREMRGIITKDEILNILKKYQVSQKFMSKLLGWGEITLTRYISGGYTPNLENSNKLKELENPHLFWEVLEHNVVDSDGRLKEETISKKISCFFK